MPTMEILSAIISAVVGAMAGFVSSYIFWKKQRQLDRPRMVLELSESTQLSFVARNKGGTFAERVSYSFEGSHVPFDEAFAPNESRPLHLDLNEADATIVFEYVDVFGKRYTDAWHIRYDEDMGEPYYFVERGDESEE